eukprot:scaffold42212_cov64-Phaeocystis_antarctica.AAC.3
MARRSSRWKMWKPPTCGGMGGDRQLASGSKQAAAHLRQAAEQSVLKEALGKARLRAVEVGVLGGHHVAAPHA